MIVLYGITIHIIYSSEQSKQYLIVGGGGETEGRNRGVERQRKRGEDRTMSNLLGHAEDMRVILLEPPHPSQPV